MINGRIAQIISDKEVVLNVGEESGVKINMKFVIYEESDHIIDPETGNDLGALEIVKARVVVNHVMPRISRAESETYTISTGYNSLALAAALVGSTETRRRKLQVEESDIKPVKENKNVKIGDLVRSVESS